MAVQNVGDIERAVRTDVGGAILATAAALPRASRWPFALLGLFAAMTGLTGWCPAYHRAGVTSLGGPGDRPRRIRARRVGFTTLGRFPSPRHRRDRRMKPPHRRSADRLRRAGRSAASRPLFDTRAARRRRRRGYSRVPATAPNRSASSGPAATLVPMQRRHDAGNFRRTTHWPHHDSRLRAARHLSGRRIR